MATMAVGGVRALNARRRLREVHHLSVSVDEAAGVHLAISAIQCDASIALASVASVVWPADRRLSRMALAQPRIIGSTPKYL